jgi:hypothetical protein
LTQTSHVSHPQNAPHLGQAWSKSDSKKGHFILEAETVLRTYLSSHCSWETQQPSHASEKQEVWSKSGNDKRYFTLEDEIFSRPYLAWHYSGVTQTSRVALLPHAQKPVQVWL